MKTQSMRVRLDRMTELVNELRANQIKGRCETCKFLKISGPVLEYYCDYYSTINWVDYSHYCSRWEASADETQK